MKCQYHKLYSDILISFSENGCKSAPIKDIASDESDIVFEPRKQPLIPIFTQGIHR